MSILNEFLPRLQYKTLMPYDPYEGTAYHYTSLGNVNSILLRDDSVSLWASRYDCLNDASEGTLPKMRFEHACSRLRKSGKIDDKFFELIKDVQPNRTKLFLTRSEDQTRLVRGDFRRYVVSFSEDPDALAMWNYYSKGNRYEGMNIGIDIGSMKGFLDSTLNFDGSVEVQTAKVVYNEEEQISIIEKAILDLREHCEPRYESSVGYCIGTLLSNLKPVLKLECFEHEKEVRLFVDILNKPQNKPTVKYRTNAGFIIPYIELGFGKSSVRSIMLGPSLGDIRQKKAQEEVAREMMEGHGYQVAVESSKIPVRY